MTLVSALVDGIATHLHTKEVGFFGPSIPPGTAWPIYRYEWGAADQQLVVNLPITVPDTVQAFDTSLQILTRAWAEDDAEQQAARATDALTPTPFPRLGGVSIHHIEHMSLARLGKDQNGRAMWVTKFRLYGHNKTRNQ